VSSAGNRHKCSDVELHVKKFYKLEALRVNALSKKFQKKWLVYKNVVAS